MPSKWLAAYLSQLFVVALCLNQSYANPPQTTPPPGPLLPNATALAPETFATEIAELDRKIKSSQAAENDQIALQ
jgi:hypothetical protein